MLENIKIHDNLKFIDGDIVELDVDGIVHQANCFATMRSGVAKAITDVYPEVRDADTKFPYDCGFERAGQFSFAIVNQKNTGKPLLVGNLYGQIYYGRSDDVYTIYKHLDRAFHRYMKNIRVLLKKKDGEKVTVGIPYKIGCGLANGNWSIVLNMIRNLAEDYPDINFVVVKYVGA